MPLTVHHLGKSQSERIVFLLEELAVPYELELHERNPETALAPESLKAIHPYGTAPVVVDEEPNPNNARVILAESGAIVEYILETYGKGKLAKKVGDADYADYLAWLHYSNGTLQPTFSRMNMLQRASIGPDNMVYQFVEKKIFVGLAQLEERLGEARYLAGDQLTAADCMMMFTLTTMRGFHPVDLSPYPNILAYLKRVSEREGYRRAMAKGDAGLEPMIGARVDKFQFGSRK